MQEKNEKAESGNSFADVIQKNRKVLLVIAIIIAVAAVACIVFFSLKDVYQDKAITAVEELGTRYNDLSSLLNEEDSSEDVLALLQDLTTFAKTNNGYAGGRAWYIAGSAYSERKEWEQAEEAWINAAKKIPKTYMAPIAWFNAGAAAEEQGRAVEAIEYYRNSIDAPAGFASAPRAQFSIGRLWESLDNIEAAIDAYRAVINDWPQDQTWKNMAQSRIIVLEK